MNLSFTQIKYFSFFLITCLFSNCSNSDEESYEENNSSNYDITPILSKFVGSGLSYPNLI